MCSLLLVLYERCILEHCVWLVPVHVSLCCWYSSADSNFKCSASVFGVSTQSMQCSYDSRGNSVPTILLMMQRRLYEQGGLRVWRFSTLIDCNLLFFKRPVAFPECWPCSCCFVFTLQAEGIFRINAENSQEEFVRDHLNSGTVPDGIDVHCLAGLIKVSFLL